MNHHVGSYISGFLKEKREIEGVQRRLLIAFVAVLVIITLYTYIGIEFASASDVFVPR
jgi:hypothetical protein